ncbi:vq domain-containing protein [Abeliophyllum distichum]|uniref:Vq domain-containing protein n=1 Tax=Abeliophyllum distichum TaxID=126358 RepID=A0ABD1RTP0_9LAMI
MSSHKKKTKSKRSNKNSLKVVYISSPMKVKTSATRFRSLVQELTGRHSDVSRFMESNDSNDFHEFDDNSDGSLQPKSVNDDHLSSISTQRESPTSSDSTFFEPMDNVFTSHLEEQFADIFSSDLFFDSSELDVLGSYEDL